MDIQDTLPIEDAPVPTKDIPDFGVLYLSARECVTVYGALRAYGQALIDADQLETLSIVLEIQRNLQPMAQRAASLFQQSQTVAPE